MKKILLIDGQVFQSGAWHRGMGKYSLELIKALLKLSDGAETYLLLNKNIEIESKALDELTPLFGKKYLIKEDLIIATRLAQKDRADNKKILNDLLQKRFDGSKISFLILSLFLDNGCAVFPDNSEKHLLFYDSIPFLFPDKYINRINYDNYLTHYATVFEADKIFAISQTVADDTVLNFGISEEKVVNINGARIGDPPKHKKQPTALQNVEKYILCPTGDELRKNNLRAVQGFELFNKRNNNKYKLVLTSFFSDYTKQQLSAISDNLIFTGNIAFEELEWLYENSDILLFPSEYEGLGLPILEAVTHNKIIACSDIPVFREISSEAFVYFDPKKPVEIAHAIEASLSSTDKPELGAYREIEKKYSWENTARLVKENIYNHEYDHRNIKKIKLAILAPSPDGYSAIGKVVAETHASLAEYFDITYYFEKGPQHRYLRPDYLSKVARSYPISKFNGSAYKEYDAVLYHIGNSEYHLSIIANALVYPGYCIFHDTNLTGAYGLLKDTGLMSAERYALEVRLDKVLKTKKGKFLSTLASAQKANFVHSEYAQKALAESSPAIDCAKLNLPVDVPKLKRNYNTSDRITVGLAGIIAGIKGLELIEELSAKSGSSVDIVVFGYLQSDVIKDQLKRLPNVTLATNPTDFEFQTMLGKLDVLLNYRMKYQGETSLTVLEAMRYGVVAIVRDIGWYAELPSAAVVKAKTKEDALKLLDEFIDNPKKLASYRISSIEYIAQNHSHAAYAKAVYDATSNTQAR